MGDMSGTELPKMTRSETTGRPNLVRRVNVGAVVRRLQVAGPRSRAQLARETGISFPTVTKVCDYLEELQLVEPCGEQREGLGRPSRLLRMASTSAQVVAVSIGPERLRVATAGLDGQILEERLLEAPTSYDRLCRLVVEATRQLQRASSAKTLGLGIALPGLVERESETVLASPNVPYLDGQTPSRDLQKRTGLEAALVESMEAAFLAERVRGEATDLDDFAILNYRGGMGLAAASSGRLIQGADGLAGELGHIVVDPGGRRCGCGNRGCLETVATDVSLAKTASRRLRRKVSVDELIDLLGASPRRSWLEAEVRRALDFMAMGIGTVVNLVNPRCLLLLGRFLEAREDLFPQLLDRVPRYCVPRLADRCEIRHARTDTLQGAALAIVRAIIARHACQETAA